MTLSKPIANPSWPTINLEDHGVAPGNLSSTNTNAIANLIAKVKSASIPGSHIKLNRGGTTLVGPGPSSLHQNLRAAILLPSNCKFELGPATELKMTNAVQCYVVRNDNPMTGNVNIEFCGGQVNGNKTGNLAPGAPGEYSAGHASDPYYGFISRWENVTRFYHHDQYQIDAVSWANNILRATDCLIENLTFDVWRDAYHVSGGSTRITLRSLRGHTGDNFIAVGTGEGQYWAGNFIFNDGVNGAGSTYVDHDISDIVIDDLQSIGSNGPVRIFGYVNRRIDRVKVRTVTGSTSVASVGAVQLIDDNYGGAACGCHFSNIDIDGISVLSGSVSEPQVVIGTTYGGVVEDVSIRNVTANVGKGVRTVGTINSLVIDNVVNPGLSTAHLLELNHTGKRINISNCCSMPASGSGRLLHMDSALSWDNFTLENPVFNGTTNTALIVSNLATAKTIDLVGAGTFIGGTSVVNGPLKLLGGTIRMKDQGYLTQGSVVEPDRFTVISGGTGFGRANGAGSMLTVGPQWLNRYVPYTEVAALAGSVNYLPVIPLPRGAIVTRIAIHVDVAFAGGAISAMTFKVNSGNPAVQIGDTFDIKTAATTKPLFSAAFTPYSWAKNLTPTLVLYFTATSANLSALTAGGLNVYIEYSIMGVNH